MKVFLLCSIDLDKCAPFNSIYYLEPYFTSKYVFIANGLLISNTTIDCMLSAYSHKNQEHSCGRYETTNLMESQSPSWTVDENIFQIQTTLDQQYPPIKWAHEIVQIANFGHLRHEQRRCLKRYERHVSANANLEYMRSLHAQDVKQHGIYSRTELSTQ